MTRLLPLLSVLVLAACGGDAASPGAGSGAVGSTGGTGGAGGAGGAPPAVPFSAIYPMFFPNTTNARCNFCHSMPANQVGNGKLHMGDDVMTAYQALVGKNSMSSGCMGRPLVVPGQPDMSLFYLKLTPTPPCGVRMPNGGNPLTDAQLAMIHDWIAAGAPLN